MTTPKTLRPLAALGATITALAGCPSPNLYTTPRALPQGQIQHTVAMELVGASAGVGSGALPTLPSYQMRYGLGHRMDIGARIANMTGIGADFKLQFVEGSVDIAVDPGFQMYALGLSSSSEGASAAFGYAHLPLLIGFNIGTSATVFLSPGFTWAFGTIGTRTDGIAARTGAIGRLGVGANLRIGTNFAVAPELTMLKSFDTDGVVFTLGLGLQFGAMPAH